MPPHIDKTGLEAAALVALARANIPADVQELLVHGNPARDVAPGALFAAISAACPTTSAGVTEEQTPRVTDAMVEAACAATVLGEDEFGKPVHLSPAEARCALEASRVEPVSQTNDALASAIRQRDLAEAERDEVLKVIDANWVQHQRVVAAERQVSIAKDQRNHYQATAQVFRKALERIVDLDHHNMGPESEATKIARAALTTEGTGR